MRKKNKHYDSFSKSLQDVGTKTSGWGGFVFVDPEKPIKYWNSLSDFAKRKIVSDSRWNHYPMKSWTKSSRKKYGEILDSIVSGAISNLNKDDLNVLTNSSQGVFALFMLDRSPSSIRIKMAKRLYKSPDVRIRTRCARILPIKYMPFLIEDKSYSVRNTAITRVGFDNCYKGFIPESIAEDPTKTKTQNWWYRNWLERQALRLCDRDELKSLVEEAKLLTVDNLSSSSFELKLAALLDRMSPEECLYFMEFTKHSTYIERAIKNKLSS